MPTGGQEADEDVSQDMDQELRTRTNRLRISLTLGRRKKRNTFMTDKTQFHNLQHRSDALDPYRKFVAFYTRSENPFVNYYLVLDAGMAWEASEFGDLTRDQSVLLFHAF